MRENLIAMFNKRKNSLPQVIQTRLRIEKENKYKKLVRWHKVKKGGEVGDKEYYEVRKAELRRVKERKVF
jgi:hypothetical protein